MMNESEPRPTDQPENLAEVPEPDGDASEGPSSGSRRLVRSRDDRVIAGVAGGLGAYFGIDPILFRIGFVLLVIAGAGSGLVLYVIAWVVLPEGDTDRAGPSRVEAGGVLLGGILVAVGLFWLAETVFPSFGRYIGPIGLLLLGAALVWGGGRRDR
jgi:phage shock protein PspC (stress-responsive transcriptional regulator)